MGNVGWFPSLHICGSVWCCWCCRFGQVNACIVTSFFWLHLPNAMWCGISSFTFICYLYTHFSEYPLRSLAHFLKPSCSLSCWVLPCYIFTKVNMFLNLFWDFFFDPYYLQICVHVAYLGILSSFYQVDFHCDLTVHILWCLFFQSVRPARVLGSLGNGVWCQTWQPELNPFNPRGGGKELTPSRCLLFLLGKVFFQVF